MKVTILTSAHPADDKRVFQRHAKYLAEQGFDVTLLAPGVEGEERVAGVRILGVGPRRGYLGRLASLPRIGRMARDTGADLYHFHDPDLLPVGLWLRQRTGRPVVYDAHENYRLAALSSRGLPPGVAPVVATVVDVVERGLSRCMSAVVSPHPARLRDLVDGSHTPALVLPNVPRMSFTGGERGSPPRHPPEAVYIGLLSPERGAGMILDAAEALPDVHFRLHVAFGAPDGMEEYRRQIRSRGLGNVAAEGYVPYDALARVLAGATVGLLPWSPTRQHLHAAQPTKLFEYMAMGLPVVAADLPITRAIVGESGGGLLHRPDDPRHLAECIREVVDDPRRREAMGARGREAFLRHHSFEAAGDRLIGLYRALVDPDGPGRVPAPPAAHLQDLAGET